MNNRDKNNNILENIPNLHRVGKLEIKWYNRTSL